MAGPLRFPLSYLECATRFRQVAHARGLGVEEHPIDVSGRHGEALSIDVVHVGAPQPRRAVLVMSGVHGVEGAAGSALQTELLGRIELPTNNTDAVVLVHAVNPWGMSWWRRQNENNVDLNRNWQEFGGPLPHNDAYSAMHPIVTTDVADLPGTDTFVAQLAEMSATHGLAWVREAVSGGQYSHPDGLYFGGTRREQSTQIVEEVAVAHLGGVTEVLIVDLHTGHGPYGTYTLLSRAPLGTDDDRWLKRVFDPERVEATASNPEATSAPKRGQLSVGIIERLNPRLGRSVTLELGTRSETRMLAAEFQEHWVHRHGDRADPAHHEVVWQHRCCSIPDDPEWEDAALAHGQLVLDQALSAALDTGLFDTGLFDTGRFDNTRDEYP